jgi:two-component system, chemotaxis family, sensor kinase CheA
MDPILSKFKDKFYDHTIALLTDSIVGEHQAVLKSIGKSFGRQEYISSASQLGDGNLAFMIDTFELMRLSQNEKIVALA